MKTAVRLFLTTPQQNLLRGENLAEWTGLEPATPGVTGRYSNQLNYHSWQAAFACNDVFTSHKPSATTWRPYGDSNPGTHRERVMS